MVGDEELLLDRITGDFAMVPAHAPVRDALGASADWVVIVDGELAAAIARSELAGHDPGRPMFETVAPAVLADAETPVDALLESPVFEAAPATVLALRGDQVIGVWAARASRPPPSIIPRGTGRTRRCRERSGSRASASSAATRTRTQDVAARR